MDFSLLNKDTVRDSDNIMNKVDYLCEGIVLFLPFFQIDFKFVLLNFVE